MGAGARQGLPWRVRRQLPARGGRAPGGLGNSRHPIPAADVPSRAVAAGPPAAAAAARLRARGRSGPRPGRDPLPARAGQAAFFPPVLRLPQRLRLQAPPLLVCSLVSQDGVGRGALQCPPWGEMMVCVCVGGVLKTPEGSDLPGGSLVKAPMLPAAGDWVSIPGWGTKNSHALLSN